MFKEERYAFILRELKLNNRVVSKELAKELNVSEDTIRRDLLELAEAKKLLKVHGGALPVSMFETKG